ncbi:MAG: alpha/beta hydrolase [Clostridia bacterium]
MYDTDKNLYLNIYRPIFKHKNKKLPVFVYLHGGGWICGSPEGREAYTTKMAGKGYFVVSVYYGLSPNYVHPQHIENVYKAIAWIVKNEKKYNLDLNSIFFSGESAGAHLASMVGAISSNKSYKALFNLAELSKDIKVKGLVLNCGVFDLEQIAKSDFINADFYAESYCGMPVEKLSAELKKEVSPIYFVTDKFPPCFFVSGERDKLKISTNFMIDELKKHNIYYEHFEGKGRFAIHAFTIVQVLKISRLAFDQTVTFLRNFTNKN